MSSEVPNLLELDMTKEPEKDITMKQLIRIKGHGVLSAESIVTARVTVTHHFDDGTDPVTMQVQITAPASDLDLFLLPYTEEDDIDLDFEILDILQPYIGKHNDSLKWLDTLINREKDDG